MIDFHTHIFPEKIASRAIASLEQKAKMRAHVSGVEASLRASMDKSGVDLSIILPVVTNPHQFETVNRVAVETNEHTKETGLLSFGGIHPDNDNYREIIQFLAGHGCKGIKIHPVYQGVAIDDIRFLRIIDCAEEYGLVTITHAGYDIGFPESFKISSAVTLLMSSYRSMFSNSFDHFTLNTSCPRCSKAFPMLLVPANNSNTFIVPFW